LHKQREKVDGKDNDNGKDGLLDPVENRVKVGTSVGCVDVREIGVLRFGVAGRQGLFESGKTEQE
jgi:hypothetical protein